MFNHLNNILDCLRKINDFLIDEEDINLDERVILSNFKQYIFRPYI